MSYADPFEDEGDQASSSNYIGRHWNGRNSLPFAYWVNGSLLTGALTFAVTLLRGQIEKSDASLRVMASAGLALIAVSLVAWIWSSVGIWRSATRHPYRGGSGGWAMAAKIVMVLGGIGMVARAPSLFLATREFGQLAAGSDPIGRSASITVRPGGVLQVDGFLSLGFADRFAETLRKNRNVRVVVLNSPGGRILEGERFARQAKAAGLDTIAEGECASACILPFLAGKRRLLGANARLGFHQPSFPGASAAENQLGIDAFKRSIIEAGVSQSFANQAVTAAPDDMWYPDFRTLVDAGVITGVDRGAIIADNTFSAQSLSKGLPKRLDSDTWLTRVSAIGTTFQYDHKVTIPADQIAPGARDALRRSVTTEICAKPGMAMMVRSGAVYRYVYRDSRGIFVMQFDVARC
jgi:hypothetical protein